MKARYCLLAFALALALPASSQSQNVFPPSGRVGIGTNSPFAPLHIVGDSFMGRDSANLVQLEFKGVNSWNIVLGRMSSTSTIFGLSSGAGLIFTLTNNGELELGSLRGTGTRMLVANPGGVIGTAPVPKLATAGDNLGNHTATTTLNMNSRDVVNVHRLIFDGSPNQYQTSASPWIYYNFPQGYRAANRFLIGNGNIDPSYMLKIEGDAYATGVWTSSDASLKSNLMPISDPIRKLLNVRGLTYSFGPDPASPLYRTVGLVAQDVRAVLPEAVRENSDGKLALNYNAIVALLVEAVKEQQATIRTQQERMDQLERRLSMLERAPKK